MQKNAEKVKVLTDAGMGLIIRLYHMRQRYAFGSPDRPVFLTDATYSKPLAILTKKFPDAHADWEKAPGYDLLMSKASIFFAEMEPHWDTFVDVIEWADITNQELRSIAGSATTFGFTDAPVFMEALLDLLVLYAQMHILFSLIEDRKLFASLFARLFHAVKAQQEPHFNVVVKYMQTYEEPIKRLQEEMKPISSRVGLALLSFGRQYDKLNNLQELRKEGLLNPTLHPDHLALPSHNESNILFMIKDKMYKWIIFGFLLCPEELAAEAARNLCVRTLHHGFRAPIFRDLSISVHNYYEATFKYWKSKTFKLSKERKLVSEAANAAAVGYGAQNHRSMRIYLRQSLKRLYSLFKDFPGLMGPKAFVLWSALNAARAEILWYFQHLSGTPPKTKDKFLVERFRDPHISELIYYVLKLADFISENQRILQVYYLEYLAGVNLAEISKMADSAPGAVQELLNTILTDLKALSVDDLMNGAVYDLSGLRMNWLRVEAILSTSPTSQAPLIRRGHLIYLHSRNVDDIGGLLEEACSLKQLWYFRKYIMEAFDKSIIEGPNNPVYCMGFLRLFGQFPDNASIYWPEERDKIGPESVQLAEKCVKSISDRITTILLGMTGHFLKFSRQLKDENAAYEALLAIKDHKFEKGFEPPVPPASESDYKNRKDIDGLRLNERNVWQLCAAMEEYQSVIVYDHEIVPREYLVDKLSDALNKYIQKELVVDPQTMLIKRPSIIESSIKQFFSVLHMVENYVNIDVGVIIRKVLLKHTRPNQLTDVHKIDWSVEGEIQWDEGEFLIKTLSTFYADFVSKRIQLPGTVYSPLRKAFISRANLPFHAEEYGDLCELQSVARMVGPYGIKTIDREVLKFIQFHISGIKDLLSINRKVLAEISTQYDKDITAQLKQLKDVDAFVHRSTNLGNALHFRALLQEAERSVSSQTIPFIHDTVSILFDEYPRNTFMISEYLGCDALAAAVGLPLGTADQPLKAIISKVMGEQDKELWNLIPFMYAASFVTSKVWGEAVFRPFAEAHTNGAHTIVLCIQSLIVAAHANAASPDVGEIDIRNLLRKFIEASSCILLRQAREGPKVTEKLGIQSFASVIIFMDKFIQSSPVLTQDALEACMPYALLRSQYKELYDPPVKKKRGGAPQEEATM
ncbi:hypothetical protein QOT17_019527 [Balamuthia mandrillaris]